MKPLLVAALAAAVSVVHAQPRDGAPVPGPKLEARASTDSPYKTITWDELVPKGWDPMKDFKGMDLAALKDSDPRAIRMLSKMREAWDNAPTNPAMVGRTLRIAGFVVPLEESKDGLREFLLVPYFGACIHTPPPAANQIIHVLLKAAEKNLHSMDPVWVSGTLAELKTFSYMGAASYRLDAQLVEPYKQQPAR